MSFLKTTKRSNARFTNRTFSFIVFYISFANEHKEGLRALFVFYKLDGMEVRLPLVLL